MSCVAVSRSWSLNASDGLRTLLVRRRGVLLGSSALVGVGLLFTSVPGVQAACEIGGQVVDAANALVAGDNLVCNDIDLVEPIQANENGVTITFGDGNGAADTTLTLDATDARDAITVQSDSTVTINADAAITAPNSASAGIFAIGDNNTITVNGGTIDVADDGLQANGSNNTLTMNGGSIVAGKRRHPGEGQQHGDHQQWLR